MKTFKMFIVAGVIIGAFLAGPRPAYASAPVYEANLVDNATLAYSTTAVLDVSAIDNLAMQAVYSSATISAFSLDDGRKATGTITVLSTSSLTTARLAINGCVLDQGDSWTSVSTASGTAKAISDSIMASSCLSGVVVSTWSSNVIYSTASTIGTAGNSITLFTNTSSITISGATLSNGDDSNFSIADDDITTSSAHGITTGAPLLFATATGTAPTGLTTGTTYYAIVTANNKFKFATSSANALAGTAINITALTGSGTFTATLTAFSGTWSFKWQGSNDNSNWYDLPISAVTYSTPSNSLWDGPINYRYLRLNFTAGTGGALNLKVRGYGRRYAL